jgi:hypothetical protein
VITGVMAEGFEHNPAGSGGETAGDRSFGVAVEVGVSVDVDAKPSEPSEPPIKQSSRAPRIRGLKIPAS